jgi:hypothetical protein
MISVVMLSTIYAKYRNKVHYDECHYVKCNYADRHGALKTTYLTIGQNNLHGGSGAISTLLVCIISMVQP